MDTPDLDKYFSSTYEEARQRFREAAAQANASLGSLTLQAQGPGGAALTIDIARIGSTTPRRAFLHSSGIHGVEGFTGSAIQIKALEELHPVDGDNAIILAHGLNPYGMAWLRRFNESNVDLNRNFLEPTATWAGISDTYKAINDFLNPKLIRSWDPFYFQAIVIALKYGIAPLWEAIAGGQYENPKGLFFGGKHLEEGPSAFKTWLRKNISSVERLFVIDVHTGLGKWRQNSLFHKLKATKSRELAKEFRVDVVADNEESDVAGYRFRGGQADVYRQLFEEVHIDFVIQEFGTYSGVRVLKALRAENCQHHYGDGGIKHPRKIALKNVFYPPSEDWRAGVLQDGVMLFRAAMGFTFAQTNRSSKQLFLHHASIKQSI